MSDCRSLGEILPEILSRLGSGRERNDEFVCCCPFHEERNPSFSLNMEKGVYYCFGCGASGGLNQLATKLGIITEGTHKPVFKRKSKPMKMLPWQLAKRISESFDTLEDCWYTKVYRKKRNDLEMDWNEGRNSEADYYYKRQLLDYEYECLMEIHDHNRNRLTYEAKHGADIE